MIIRSCINAFRKVKGTKLEYSPNILEIKTIRAWSISFFRSRSLRSFRASGAGAA